MSSGDEVLRGEIERTWKVMRGEQHLPRFLARPPDRDQVWRCVKTLRALYTIAGDRISLGEMLVLSGGVHGGDR